MTKTRFCHHMIREIYEQPQAVEATLEKGLMQYRSIVNEIYGKYQSVYITGSGTSYHAGLVAQYVLAKLTGIPSFLTPASEFPVWLPTAVPRKSLLIAFSQSGESRDVLVATQVALNRGIDVLAIVNRPGSTLTKIAHYTLLTYAGDELALAATKSYTAQLATIFLFALELAAKRQIEECLPELNEKLMMTPKLIAKTINSTNDLARRLAHKHCSHSVFFLLGRGLNYATALEGALKLKETCNVFAEGFATREFLHGPIQLVNKETPIIIIIEKDEVNSLLNLIEKLRSFGAPVISISNKRNRNLEGLSTEVIYIPEEYPKIFSPIIYVVPLQLLAYYTSVARGLNPDNPDKLKKVVK